jgi:hypothetical protein
MQVEVLKLSAGVGRSLERGTALQSRNDQLQASVAQLADDQRIMRLAATQDGMVMPSPTAPTFLSNGVGASIGKALSNIHAPDASTFASSIAALDQSPTTGSTDPTAAATSPTSTAATPTTESTASGATSSPSPTATGTEPTTASGTTSDSGATAAQSIPTSPGTSSAPVGVATTPTGG